MDPDRLYRPGFDKLALGNNPYGRGLDDDSVKVQEILTKFWIRKRLIFFSIIIFSGLAYVVAKLITPVYTGTALVMVKPMLSSGPLVEATPTVPIQTSPEVVQSEVFVLQSSALAAATIRRLHLDRDPELDPSLQRSNYLMSLLSPVSALYDQAQSWLRAITGVPSGAADASTPDDDVAVAAADEFPTASKPSTRIITAFLSRLQVTVQQKSNVIQVSYRSSRPETAAKVPNTLVQLYFEQRSNEKDKTLADEAQRLDNVVLPTLHQKLQASEMALEEYRRQTGLVSNQSPTVLTNEVSETKAQLAIARARTAEAAVRLNQAQSASGGSSATASESPTLQVLREQEVNLEAQLGVVKASLGPNHPKTIQIESQLRQLKDGIRREGAGFVSRLKAELAAVQATEAELTKRAAEFARQFAQINGGDVKLQNLVGEAEADRKTYERYLTRTSEVHSSIGHAQPDAVLVSRADVPLKPSPSIKMIVLAGAAIGAGIGIVLVAMLDGLRPGLRSKEQVEEALGVQCLGLLPKVEGVGRRHPPTAELAREIEGSAFLQPQSKAYGHAIRSARLKLLSHSGADREPHAGESRAEEAARMVLAPTSTSIRLHRAGSGVVLVTAALPNEGKTWVATALTNSLATDGFSVALVDFDLHRPSVHRMFGGPRGPGVTDYFAGDSTLDEIIHTDEDSGVNYVPVGAAASKQAWRITSSRVRSLVDRLSERHAFIILDSAPVLAVSETIVLSQVVRQTILVVKWGSTSPTIARHAVTQLLESGGAETAVLLSMVDVKRAAKYGDALAGAYKRLGSYHSH